MFSILTAVLFANSTIAEKVVAYAQGQLGRQVGDGECTTFATEALRLAGAKRPASGVWGEELPSLKDVRPGDILQFEQAVFVRTRTLPDGSVLTVTMSYPHHTAIVWRVRKRGRRPVFVVLHQNAEPVDGDEAGRKVVQERVVSLAELRRGTLRAFRPVAE